MGSTNDDIQIESDANLDESVLSEEHQGDTIKKLKEKLKAAEEKAKEYLDSWQRAQADFVNMRKRDEDAKMEFLRFAKSDVVSELIPVLDSFTLAIQHGDPSTASGQENGIKPIYKQFLQILKQHGLEELDPRGEMFDPRLHEAVGTIETEKESEDHKILEVVQKGYILSGKVIRPAKVRIGDKKS